MRSPGIFRQSRGVVSRHSPATALRRRTTIPQPCGPASRRLMQSKSRRGSRTISAGFEYDGWTELERSEYVSVVQYTDLFADDHAKGFWYWFWNHTPNLQAGLCRAELGLSRSRERGGELKVDFRAWMPPFQRSAVVWKRSGLDGGAAGGPNGGNVSMRSDKGVESHD